MEATDLIKVVGPTRLHYGLSGFTVEVNGREILATYRFMELEGFKHPLVMSLWVRSAYDRIVPIEDARETFLLKGDPHGYRKLYQLIAYAIHYELTRTGSGYEAGQPVPLPPGPQLEVALGAYYDKPVLRVQTTAAAQAPDDPIPF